LNFIQKAQLAAAAAYSKLTGWTVGFGAGIDGAIGVGKGLLKVGGGGSASTLMVVDNSGNSGFLNSWAGGFSFFKGKGGVLGGGIAGGVAVMVSPRPIAALQGGSVALSAAGGDVLGGGVDITTNRAVTVTLGVGAGAEVGIDLQYGKSYFTPICHH
jgi:hypothetical protein